MKMRLSAASLATATALTFASPVFAADSAQDFVNKAAAGGMFEVDSSKVVLGKTSDQQVKDFAQKMIDEHRAANAKLAAIAQEQKLQLPASLVAKHKADLDTLSNTADPVNAPYIQMQREAHAEAVTLFETYAKDGDNAPLKSFAAETLPTLKMHYEMAEAMASGTPDGHSGSSTSTTPAVNTQDTTNPAAPVPGANSFTKDQARDRIQEAGFTDVTALTKDDQGIWRGQAVKNGKSTAVALDFQGNVVVGAN